ncbi:TPA: hypothetical protein DD712_03450 [Candidatus Acetothermia bacterium]|nr:hypothetical protein [Candidatus Acetothermia bacterium]
MVRIYRSTLPLIGQRLYIFGIDANGTIRLIFPNTFTSGNFVQEGVHRLPDGDWQFMVQPPAGIAHLQIIASLQRLPLPEPNPHAAGKTITYMLKHIPAAWWTTAWVSFTVAAPPTVTVVPAVCPPWTWWVPSHWVIAWQHVCPDAGWRFTIKFHFRVPLVTIPPITVVELKARIFAPFIHVDMSVPIRFTARGSRGPIIRYHWDFGDSHTAQGFEVWHTFTRPGPHHVRLTVFDAAGRAHTATRVIWVR